MIEKGRESVKSAPLIVVGCANGAIHMLDPIELTHLATLPFPIPLPCAANSPGSTSLYPACYAVQFITQQQQVNTSALSSGGRSGGASTGPLRIGAVYADRSMVIWEVNSILTPVATSTPAAAALVTDTKPAVTYTFSKLRSFLSHRECIWDVVFLPSVNESMALGGLADDSVDRSGNSNVSDVRKRARKQVFPDGTFVTCSADNTIR